MIEQPTMPGPRTVAAVVDRLERAAHLEPELLTLDRVTLRRRLARAWFLYQRAVMNGANR